MEKNVVFFHVLFKCVIFRLTKKCNYCTIIFGVSDRLTSFGEGKIKMKSTGVVRKLDDLGRIVIPIELRRTMDIGLRDTLEIFVEDDKIILKKYHPACIFCNDARDVIRYKDKLICKNCLEQLKKEL